MSTSGTMGRRRKQKPFIKPKYLVGAVVGLVAAWFFVHASQALPRGSGNVMIAAILFAGAGAVACIILRFGWRAYVRQALFRIARTVTEENLSSLTRRRAQLVRPDAYGKPLFDRWEREIDYFVQNHIEPLLTSPEIKALPCNYDQIVRIIWDRVEVSVRNEPALRTFSNNMSPTEFEAFCAEQLRQVGWHARVTMQSRDQGVDIIAEKKSRRVVFQCKLYSRGVGNKCVQEITAGRVHEQADYGVVVSNSRYTDAAEQLAATNGILLLHYRDLGNIDEILDGLRKISSSSRR